MTDKEKRIEAERLAAFLKEQYHYKPVPITLDTGDVRSCFRRLLPEWCNEDGEDSVSLITRCGTVIANGYNRIVVGDYGAFIEILPERICKTKIRVKPGQEYRINNPQYDNCKYVWMSANDDSQVKIYHQKHPVDYADYVPGRYYISPFDVRPTEVETGFWKDIEPNESLARVALGDDADASWFLHGFCGIFALALHERFGYEIEVAAEEDIDGLPWESRLVHIYCRHEGLFVDARGAVGDKKRFLCEFEDFYIESDCFPVTKEELEAFLHSQMPDKETAKLKKKAEKLLEDFSAIYDVR